jgi:peptidoglycan/LPS O-acetylase OafA/YrhL
MTGHFLRGYFSKHIGWSGVDLFLVLSGFFVSGILFREFLQNGRIKPGRFLIRRGLKIWPLFYTVLIIQLTYLISKGWYPGTKQILAEVFFIQNYVEGFMVISWTIGIEEQFYLLLALSLPVIIKFFKIKGVVATCIIIMIVCPLLRLGNFVIHPEYDPYKHFFPLPLRADALCSGILISYFYNFKKEYFLVWVSQKRKILSLSICILLLPLFFFSYTNRFTLTVGFTLTYLGYSFLVILMLGLANKTKPMQLSFKVNKIFYGISWVGFYSYAIYLVHFFVGFKAVNNFKKLTGESNQTAIELIIFISASILLGYILSLLIEQPILRWRDKVYPDKNPKRRS